MFFLHFQSSAVWNSRSSRKLEEWLADWPLTLDGLLLSKGSELHPNRPCRQNISRLSTNHQVERLERSGPRKEMSPMAQILALIWSWFWHMQSSFLFFFLILFADFNLVVSVSQIFSNFLKSSCLLHRPLVGFPKVTASHIDLGASGKGHMKCEEYDRNMSLKKNKNLKNKQKMFNIHKFHELLSMAVHGTASWGGHSGWVFLTVPVRDCSLATKTSPSCEELLGIKSTYARCLKSWVVDSNWDIHWDIHWHQLTSIDINWHELTLTGVNWDLMRH